MYFVRFQECYCLCMQLSVQFYTIAHYIIIMCVSSHPKNALSKMSLLTMVTIIIQNLFLSKFMSLYKIQAHRFSYIQLILVLNLLYKWPFEDVMNHFIEIPFRVIGWYTPTQRDQNIHKLCLLPYKYLWSDITRGRKVTDTS